MYGNYINPLQGLQNMNNYREPTQPIQNIINTQMPTNDNIFMAQELKDGQTAANVLITHKTAFIDLINAKLTIKETNGNMQEYDIILPKDEKDLKIEALEEKIKKLEGLISNESTNNDTTSTEGAKPTTNAKKLSGK